MRPPPARAERTPATGSALPSPAFGRGTLIAVAVRRIGGGSPGRLNKSLVVTAAPAPHILGMQERPKVKPIISRMMMDLLRIFQEVGFDNRDYGRNLESLYILLVVFIGHAEKRPMTAARISRFLGLPRSTVVRKLAQLIQSGHVSKEQ